MLLKTQLTTGCATSKIWSKNDAPCGTFVQRLPLIKPTGLSALIIVPVKLPPKPVNAELPKYPSPGFKTMSNGTPAARPVNWLLG